MLVAHDRSGDAELSLTEDLIAVMLGVRRSTVSIAAGTLQRAGGIGYQNGRIEDEAAIRFASAPLQSCRWRCRNR